MKPLLFSTTRYAYLKSNMMHGAAFDDGLIDRKVFPDGESYHRILTDVGGRDAIIIGGTIDDVETMELYDIACGLEQGGCVSLTLVIPYFGYSTMERAVKTGELVKAKT